MKWLYYPLAFLSAFFVYSYSTDASIIYASATKHLDLAGQTEIAWKSLIEAITLNLYEGASEKIIEVQALQEAAKVKMRYATYCTIGFLFLTGAFLISQYLDVLKLKSKKNLIIHLIAVAMICLVAGITTPMLNLVAFKEVPVLGTVIFKFESKSIAGVITKLFETKNFFIAVLILLFSIITPVVKSVLSLAVYMAKSVDIRMKALHIIKLIGKWSMTDVFVVSILLAFFSISVDETTDAWLSHGLYFFAAYVILSLVIGHLLLMEKAE